MMLVFFSVMPSLGFFFLHRDRPDVIFRHWDGPNYIEVAKTLYFIPEENPFRHSFNSQPKYYACHLPLLPLLIRLFSFMGYDIAMIFVTVATAALASVALFFLLREYRCVKDPFFTAFLSTFLPIRYLLYKSIGSTEPLYLLLVFLSLIAYKREKNMLAFFLAGLAGITRITGILMAAGYFCDLVRRKRYREIPKLAVIGLPLLLTFYVYHLRFNDFLAYFHWNASIMNLKVPMNVFRQYTLKDQSIQAEYYFYMYVLYGVGTCLLARWPALFWYCLTYYVFSLFIDHNDLSRYLIPIVHLSLLVGFDSVIRRKEWRYLLPIFYYLAMFYANRSLPHNLCDEPGWRMLMEQQSWPTVWP